VGVGGRAGLMRGFNLGAGLGFPVGNLDGEVAFNNHSMFMASPDLEFAKFQVGLNKWF
jgi:hypothetical protein